MKPNQSAGGAGVTLTELLVVLVIVAILSTIAVPVYLNKAQSARIATAKVECKHLAEAEDACAIEHGFYVPLQVLDDLPYLRTTLNDQINIDFSNQVTQVVDPSLPNGSLANNSPTRADARVQNMINNWKGPFINFQRVDEKAKANQFQDYPLDPWGNPYQFCSPIGVVLYNGTIRSGVWIDTTVVPGVISTDPPFRRAGRYLVYSLGPNGQLDPLDATGNNPSDDIVYFFGMSKGERITTTTETFNP